MIKKRIKLYLNSLKEEGRRGGESGGARGRLDDDDKFRHKPRKICVNIT